MKWLKADVNPDFKEEEFNELQTGKWQDDYVEAIHQNENDFRVINGARSAINTIMERLINLSNEIDDYEDDADFQSDIFELKDSTEDLHNAVQNFCNKIVNI